MTVTVYDLGPAASVYFLKLERIDSVNDLYKSFSVIFGMLICPRLIGPANVSAEQSGISDNASLILYVLADPLVIRVKIFFEDHVPKSFRRITVIAHKFQDRTVIKL